MSGTGLLALHRLKNREFFMVAEPGPTLGFETRLLRFGFPGLCSGTRTGNLDLFVVLCKKGPSIKSCR